MYIIKCSNIFKNGKLVIPTSLIGSFIPPVSYAKYLPDPASWFSSLIYLDIPTIRPPTIPLSPSPSPEHKQDGRGEAPALSRR